MLRPVIGVWFAAGLFGLCAPAHAQPPARRGTYVGASLIGDIKRFSGDVTETVLDGQASGGGVVIGTALHPRWDLQLGVDVPRFTAASRDRKVTFQRKVITLQSITENRTVSVATLLRFRGARLGRVEIGYLGGLSFVRLERDFHTEAPPNTPSSLIPRPAASVAYAAGPTLGIDARLDLASHLSVVPALHATAFSASDMSGVLLRPGVSLRWTF